MVCEFKVRSTSIVKFPGGGENACRGAVFDAAAKLMWWGVGRASCRLLFVCSFVLLVGWLVV